MASNLNHSELVAYLIGNKRTGVSEDELIQKACERFGVDENIIEWAIEMIETAYLRVSFIRAGKDYPKSNLDKDKFLEEAVKLLLQA
jgi:hypothetical protein